MPPRDELHDAAVGLPADLSQRAWFLALLSGVDDALFATDHDDRVVFLNPAAELLTRCDAGHALGRPLGSLLTCTDVRTHEPLTLEQLFEGTAARVLCCGSEGDERPLERRVVPLRDDQGDVHGRLLFLRDCRLQQRLEERLADFERRKNEFLATLAHELRNPLAPIRNALHMLKLSDDDTRLSEQARDMMERQIHHMVRLVDDLLDVSRVSRGTIQLRRERVPLVSIVNTALEATRSAFEARHHDIDLSLPSEPIFLDVDPDRFTQVLANLLDNAAKYTEPGGHIQLQVDSLGAQVKISVRDSGIGIPREMLPHIFDLFTQVPQDIESYQGGLGIGLTLARSLVQMHGGTIEAHSDGRGQGSEMEIRLPAASMSASECGKDAADEPASVPAMAPLRILIADDNTDSAESLSKVLTLLGYATRTVHDGEQALAALQSKPADVAILDIGMPGRNGIEVARAIRAWPKGNDILLIALTGWGQEDVRRRCREAGFDYHLVKPVEPLELTRILSTHRPACGEKTASR